MFIVVQVGVYRHNILPQWFRDVKDAIANAVRLCGTNFDTYHDYEILELKPPTPTKFDENQDALAVARVRATFDSKTRERKVHVRHRPS